ncbi:MAG: NADP-dependent oxidoreductase [Pseudomonadota bacterium]
MPTPQNTQIRLAKRPSGTPVPDDFSVVAEAARPPSEGEVLVAVDFLSLDPAMRGWMNEGKSYIDPVGLGEVMRAIGVGHVVDSRAPDMAVGDHVVGLLGVQRYATVPARGLDKVDARLAPLPRYLSVLGMPGMTAYFGLLDVGRPKAGETVVVSGAAGAVGAVVGQIAKLKGCHVVGIAGGTEKCQYVVNELGFDACIDYKASDLAKGLKAHCPNGIDVYFDNVGGDILDEVLRRINKGARIVICGAISQYNALEAVKGPANYLALLVNRARMEGFVVFDYRHRYGEAAREMAGWLAAGKLKAREHIVEGLETFPERLLMLFRGENFGKLILKP